MYAHRVFARNVFTALLRFGHFIPTTETFNDKKRRKKKKEKPSAEANQTDRMNKIRLSIVLGA